MAEMISYYISKLGGFISFLNSVQIVDGVSFLSFCGGLIILMLVIHNLLLRAR